jgi:hypothetical protein
MTITITSQDYARFAGNMWRYADTVVFNAAASGVKTRASVFNYFANGKELMAVLSVIFDPRKDRERVVGL